VGQTMVAGETVIAMKSKAATAREFTLQ